MDDGPRLSVWAPCLNGSVPTLDPNCLFAATLFQARVRRGTLVTPSTLLQNQVPCLEDASGVLLAEGVDAIDAFSELHQAPSALLASLDEGEEEEHSTKSKLGRRTLLLSTFLERELQPLVYHILFSPRLFASHTYRVYAREMGFVQRRSMPQRLQSAARHEVASTEFLRSRNALFSSLADPSKAASTLMSALKDEGVDEEAQERLEREKLAQRAGIRYWPFGLTNREERARRRTVVMQRAEAAFGQAKVLDRLEAVLDVLMPSLQNSDDATTGGHFLFGRTLPSKVDVRLFSLLAPLLHLAPTSASPSSSRTDDNAPLATVLLIRNRYPALVDYVERVRTHIWQADDGNDTSGLRWPMQNNATQPQQQQQQRDLSIRLAQALGTFTGQAYVGLTSLSSALFRSTPRRQTASSSPTSSSTRAASSTEAPEAARQERQSGTREGKGPEAKTERERKAETKLAWGKAVWIATSIVGLIGTAFASGLLEISFEADEDEEEGDREGDVSGREENEERGEEEVKAEGEDEDEDEIVIVEEDIEVEDDEEVDDEFDDMDDMDKED